MKPCLVGVAGGSGSGKTYFAHALLRTLGAENCEIISQDSFYIDQSHRFDGDGGSVNFDHPDAIDFTLLASVLRKLQAGETVEIPIYDFVTHKRLAKGNAVRAKPVIIVDGILIFQNEPVRSLFDKTIFFDTPEELRYRRRLERDVQERGRTPDGVRKQFEKQVKPMHDLFVQPSLRFAQEVVGSLEEYAPALERCVTVLKAGMRG